MSKTDRFLNLLRSKGVTEYWCSPGFNPELDYPVARVALPINDSSLACEIMDMYNDDDENEKSRLSVMAHDKGTELFNLAISRLEMRTL